jgi:hypothetical protein
MQYYYRPQTFCGVRLKRFCCWAQSIEQRILAAIKRSPLSGRNLFLAGAFPLLMSLLSGQASAAVDSSAGTSVELRRTAPLPTLVEDAFS